VSTPEPFRKLFNQGMIRAYSYRDEATRKYYSPDAVEQRDGHWYVKGSDVVLSAQVEKMSKSLLNVVNPDDVIDEYGADSMRLYEMFMGPLEVSKPWQTQGIEGVHRFLHRAWRLFFEGEDDRPVPGLQDVAPDSEVDRLRHRTIAAVTEDIEGLRFNTAISRMMEFVNAMNAREVRPRSVMEDFVRILAPFAPHVAEELWERLGHPTTIASEPWPRHDPAMLEEAMATIAVQVNGKVRARIDIPTGASEAAVVEQALAEEKVRRQVGEGQIRRIIYVPDRMLNLVVSG
jgi:leucyl-tRNA synthetase